MILAVLSFTSAFDPDLWSPYDWNNIARMVGLPDPPASFIYYKEKPFRLFIRAHPGDHIDMSPEAVEKVFSVYLNYTEYNYIERVHAVTFFTSNDRSTQGSYMTTIPSRLPIPMFYLNSTDTCEPQGTAVDITSGFGSCGTIGSEQCVNPGGNYVLRNDGGSAAVGFSFYPGCEASGDPPLTIFLAPNMFAIGTWGQGCFSQLYTNCATGKPYNISRCQTSGSAIDGYFAPYNFIASYPDNDQIASDGTYSSMGYCEQGSSGECFQPDWL